MIFLALRYLLERKRQTVLTLLGVFFGTVAYVAVSGFFLGFQSFMVQQLVENSPQIRIQARQRSLDEHALDAAFFGDRLRYVFWASPPAGVTGSAHVQDPAGWYARLQADPRVAAFSPLKTAPVLYTHGKLAVSGQITGCDPLQQGKVTTIGEHMTDGAFADIGAGGNRLVAGAELLRRLGATVGQTVLLAAGNGPPTPFRVVGRYSTGNRFGDNMGYGSLADVQRLAGAPNEVNEIAVRLRDYRQAAALATNWAALTPELAESWDQANANMLSMFTVQTALRFTMIATILIVAGFGIYNILTMTVAQKRQDVAILRSMGFDGLDVVTLFFAQGLLVGVVGAALGLVAGYGVCMALQALPLTAPTPGNPGGHLHLAVEARIYWQATALALTAAALASILPARAAGKLTPIEIIRAGG